MVQSISFVLTVLAPQNLPKIQATIDCAKSELIQVLSGAHSISAQSAFTMFLP